MATVYIAHQGSKSYLYYCIKSAINANNNVVFIGDDSRISKILNSNAIYNPLVIDDVRFKKFCSNWINLSLNNYEFELGCFRRFFYIYEIAKHRGDFQFWMCDSDVLIFHDLEVMTEKIKNGNYEVALSTPKSDAPYFWASSPHCSYWTLDSLSKFINFIELAYKEPRQELLDKFRYHDLHKIPGGVCDMTLLNLWIQNEKINALNLSAYDSCDLFIDHNIGSPSNFLDGANEFLIEPFLRIKKIICHDGYPHVVEVTGKKLKVLSLHFQGGSKRYMRRVSQVNSSFIPLFVDIIVIGYFKLILKLPFRFINFFMKMIS